MTKLHPDGFTSLADTADLYGVSSATLRRWWQNDLFPRPVKLKSENNENAKNYFKNSDLLEYNAKLEYVEAT